MLVHNTMSCCENAPLCNGNYFYCMKYWNCCITASIKKWNAYQNVIIFINLSKIGSHRTCLVTM